MSFTKSINLNVDLSKFIQSLNISQTSLKDAFKNISGDIDKNNADNLKHLTQLANESKKTFDNFKNLQNDALQTYDYNLVSNDIKSLLKAAKMEQTNDKYASLIDKQPQNEEKLLKDKEKELAKFFKTIDKMEFDDAIVKLDKGMDEATKNALILNKAMEAFAKQSKKGNAALDKFKQKSKEQLKEIGKDILGGIKDYFVNTFKDVLSNLKEMTEYDSNGRYTTLEKQDEMAALGVSDDAEYYATKKAMEKLNMSQDEFWMGGVNAERNKALNELVALEKNKYQEMKQSGALNEVRRTREQWEDFQTQFKNIIIKFFVKAAPAIKVALDAITSILGGILEGLNWLLQSMDDGSKSDEEVLSNIDNMMSSYTVNNNSSSNNINIVNNMKSINPAISSKRQLEQAGQTNSLIISRAIGV